MAVNVNGGALQFDAVINASQFNAAIGAIEKQLAGLTRKAEDEARSIDNLVKKTAVAIGTYASVATAANFIGDIVRVRGEFQQLEVAFRTMLKNKGAADKLLAEATTLAAKTPFTLQDVGNAAKQLLAYGFAAGNITENIEMLGNVASGVGAPLGDIVYLYGTLRTQGRAYTKDIMQFTARGIPIIDELAKQFGVSAQEVQKLVEAGKVGFPEVERAFKGLTGESGIFFNLMQEQSKTLTGLISNLQDAWSRMLNDIGKSNEGIFAGAIKGAIAVVDNYQKIIDIIGILILTYGTYRAAMILTNVQQATAIVGSRAYAIAENAAAVSGQRVTAMKVLQAGATNLLSAAQARLNAIMAINPYVLAATAIVGIVSALVLLRDNTTAQQRAQESLNETNRIAAERYDELSSKTKEYVSIINDESQTKIAQLTAFEQLQRLYPERLNNLTLESFKLKGATVAQKEFNESIDKKKLEEQNETYKVAAERVEFLRKKLTELEKINSGLATERISSDQYSAIVKELEEAEEFAGLLGDQLNKNKKIAYEASLTDAQRVQYYIQQKEKLEKQITTWANLNGGIQKAEDGSVRLNNVFQGFTIQGTINEFNSLIQKINNAKTALDPNTPKTVEVFDKDIADKRTAQKRAKTRAEFLQFEKEINELIKQRNRITGELNKQSNSIISESNKKADELKRKKQDLLNDIARAEDDARQSGLLKEEAEIDKINKRYDELKQRARDLKQSELVIQRIENARVKQVGNVKEREAFELYKKSLSDQKALFDQFEQYKVQVGDQKSKELLNIQEGDFEDYLSYVKAELLKALRSPNAGSLGGQLRIQLLSQAVVNAEKEKAAQLVEQQAQAYQEMLNATVTFKQKEKEINDRYDKLVAAANTTKDGQQRQEQLRLLQEGRDEELKQLELDAFKQSSIYKKLNEDITLFTRERIKNLIKDLQALLSADNTLPPAVKKAVEDYIKQLQTLFKESSNSFALGQSMLEAANGVNQVAGSLNSLANSVRGVNAELADTIENLAQTASLASSALSAAGSFAAGDIVGGITQSINFITQIIEGFAKAKATRIQAQNEVKAFYDNIINAELEINRIYRDRQREQVRLNKLKLDGLLAEKKLLEEQRKANEKAYTDILAQLQGESFVSGQGTRKKKRGADSFLGGAIGLLSGSSTEVFDLTSSLAGKNFEDLEKLFLSGQLKGKAKELFEQLQKIKNEGVDIDKLLEQNKIETQQLFTGTTSDNITDIIAEGFKNGKRSISDFANDFEDLMRNALINSFKFQALEGPLKEFYTQFAEFSQSDGILTQAEIDELRKRFGTIIDNANKDFANLQSIANVGFGGSNEGRSLTGAIKGITEQQADLLAGQFGGLRLTAIDVLAVSRSILEAQQKTQVNTGLTAERMNVMIERMTYYFETVGVKIK